MPIKNSELLKPIHSLSLLLLLSALAIFSPSARAQGLKELKAADGLGLMTFLFEPPPPLNPKLKKPPAKAAVIILSDQSLPWQQHQMLTFRLAQANYVALLVEQRGTGNSVRKADGKMILSEKFSNADWAALPGDLKSVLEQAAGKAWEKNLPVFLVGFGAGANAVAIAAPQLPSVKGMVLLSPTLDYHGLKPEDSIKRFGGQSMIVMADADKIGSSFAKKLSSAVPANKLQVEYSYHGNEKGYGLFKMEPFLPEKIIGFFNKIVSAK